MDIAFDIQRIAAGVELQKKSIALFSYLFIIALCKRCGRP